MNLNIIKLLNADLPATSLKHLSLVGESKPEVQAWINSLSMLNVGETAKQLYTTLQELLILDVSEVTRFNIIEVLRPAIYTIIESLSKHYVNQNIFLDERAERIAGLAQQLRIYTAIIYYAIALKTAKTLEMRHFGLFTVGKKRTLQNLTAQAIHRSLTELFRLFVESKTLYLPVYKGLWLRLHELFQKARAFEFQRFSLHDENQAYGKKLTIEQVYLRSIFISACNTNKLRQTEIKKIAQLSEIWVALIQISPQPSGQDLFLVDTSIDAPPMYITQLKQMNTSMLYINVHALFVHFENLGNDQAKLLHPSEETLLSGSLRLHLLQTLRSPSERSTERHPHHDTIHIALGLIGAHYQIANQREFEEVIQTQEVITDTDLPMIQPYAAYEASLNQNIEEMKIRQNATREFLESYQCQMVNISLGGYCVRWVGTTPAVLRSGELIAIRENDDVEWSIGLIRWVQQQLNSGAEFGIEILSQRGKPCGARVIRRDGYSSEYMRTILLPEIKELNRAASIITPILAFRSGQKISIRLGKEEIKAQLMREIIVTQSFSQFEFVMIQPDKQYSFSDNNPNQETVSETSHSYTTTDNLKTELDKILDTL